MKKNKRWSESRSDKRFSPNSRKVPPLAERIGHTYRSLSGLDMVCVAYRSANDIDVRFEDGTMKRNVRWDDFVQGRVARPHEITPCSVPGITFEYAD